MASSLSAHPLARCRSAPCVVNHVVIIPGCQACVCCVLAGLPGAESPGGLLACLYVWVS